MQLLSSFLELGQRGRQFHQFWIDRRRSCLLEPVDFTSEPGRDVGEAPGRRRRRERPARRLRRRLELGLFALRLFLALQHLCLSLGGLLLRLGNLSFGRLLFFAFFLGCQPPFQLGPIMVQTARRFRQRLGDDQEVRHFAQAHGADVRHAAPD